VVTTVASALGDLHVADLPTPLLVVVGRVVELHDRLGETRQPSHDRTTAEIAAAASRNNGRANSPEAAKPTLGFPTGDTNASPQWIDTRSCQ
jgi:hypothetical protein